MTEQDLIKVYQAASTCPHGDGCQGCPIEGLKCHELMMKAIVQLFEERSGARARRIAEAIEAELANDPDLYTPEARVSKIAKMLEVMR